MKARLLVSSSDARFNSAPTHWFKPRCITGSLKLSVFQVFKSSRAKGCAFGLLLSYMQIQKPVAHGGSGAR
jgi:hypothetical protein